MLLSTAAVFAGAYYERAHFLLLLSSRHVVNSEMWLQASNRSRNVFPLFRSRERTLAVQRWARFRREGNRRRRRAGPMPLTARKADIQRFVARELHI